MVSYSSGKANRHVSDNRVAEKHDNKIQRNIVVKSKIINQKRKIRTSTTTISANKPRQLTFRNQQNIRRY